MEVQQSLRGSPLPERLEARPGWLGPLQEWQGQLRQRGSPWLERLVSRRHHFGARRVRLLLLSLPTLEGQAQAERSELEAGQR